MFPFSLIYSECLRTIMLWIKLGSTKVATQRRVPKVRKKWRITMILRACVLKYSIKNTSSAIKTLSLDTSEFLQASSLISRNKSSSGKMASRYKSASYEAQIWKGIETVLDFRILLRSDCEMKTGKFFHAIVALGYPTNGSIQRKVKDCRPKRKSWMG